MNFLIHSSAASFAAALLLVAPGARADETEGAKMSGLTGHIQGGFGERRLFGDGATGAVATAGIGGYHTHLEAFLDLRLFVGSDQGLSLKQISFGPAIDYEVASRFRLGAGLSLGGTIIGRRTNGSSLTSFAFGGRVFASYDIWQFDEDKPHSAIYILGQLEAETEGRLTLQKTSSRDGVDTTGSWGPSLMLGARF